MNQYDEEDFVEIHMSKNMWVKLITFINDNDYCPFCDNHPSHGHSKECPVTNE